MSVWLDSHWFNMTLLLFILYFLSWSMQQLKVVYMYIDSCRRQWRQLCIVYILCYFVDIIFLWKIFYTRSHILEKENENWNRDGSPKFWVVTTLKGLTWRTNQPWKYNGLNFDTILGLKLWGFFFGRGCGFFFFGGGGPSLPIAYALECLLQMECHRSPSHANCL